MIISSLNSVGFYFLYFSLKGKKFSRLERKKKRDHDVSTNGTLF